MKTNELLEDIYSVFRLPPLVSLESTAQELEIKRQEAISWMEKRGILPIYYNHAAQKERK